ncbi:MAG: SDR family NAD(P)-dependent oxidoreductase [Acidimicrobiales bacterium]|nr:SDR family NAD(P)-dependent oxidoreductase [Acidimicrobiales bacterium]
MARLNEGRVAIITGAGRGIGREHALMLASQGAKIVVNDLGGDAAGEGADATPAQEVVAEIEAMGGEAVVNGSNVADFAAAGEMIQQAVDTFGGLDIVINNAGILRDRMIFSMSEDDWDSVINVHLKGTFGPAHHAAVYWRERSKAGEENDARIINTASPSGIYGNVGQSNYGAAKAGIAAFTQITAMELVKYGVTVNCIAPGAYTRMTANLPGFAQMDEEQQEKMGPRWIANAVSWIASPEASGVTGRVFDIVGQRIGIAEGWHLGPHATQSEDASDLKPIVAQLMADARLNADMSGNDAEGPGRPAKTI